jgi:hypothetical protein
LSPLLIVNDSLQLGIASNFASKGNETLFKVDIFVTSFKYSTLYAPCPMDDGLVVTVCANKSALIKKEEISPMQIIIV